MQRDLLHDWLTCWQSPQYFTHRHLSIYNATLRDWIPFDLWPAQKKVLSEMYQHRKLVVLKARQLGISWLSLAYALWLVLFRAPATVLLFSLKEGEAVELLSRLRAMYQRLPPHLQTRAILRDNGNLLEFSTGSRVLAFSTAGGRSYTGTLAIVDEADFIPDLSSFLNGVKPTIDAGGQLFLISTADKKRPISTFKNLFHAGRQSIGDYHSLFLPWQARPGRDEIWRKTTQEEMFAQRGTNDDFYAEYPATPEEAMAPEQFDRRLPLDWIRLCLDSAPETTQVFDAPALPGLTIFAPPQPRRFYVIGADPAEGNPNADESAACVLNDNWEEVATLAGAFEPSVFAHYLDELALYYNQADILPERNNHGHALILALIQSGKVQVLDGYDGKPGWLTNLKGKPLLYDICAQSIHSQDCTIRSPLTASQLASIEASTLSAPPGLHDDRATAFALALAGLCSGYAFVQPSTRSAPPRDEIERMDNSKDW